MKKKLLKVSIILTLIVVVPLAPLIGLWAWSVSLVRFADDPVRALRLFAEESSARAKDAQGHADRLEAWLSQDDV